ncbi:endonuclease domain-containing protein [Micromonospora yangpuensis]|uniref:DUF559 domain-containing protein n=1 Tax=Micromonospora yangpuensis TaxID=683228 RepID=A0A1C6UH78_9ACTN|nr:DUF559 domain-containing protein [Micromonospora yangpuensis]GGM04466.1 hypothetical protein GCM10012279_22780 [Micromonospora yangpuensis]SCL53259.1 Protein of unknown function [Micromonospora yangpuensis]
MRQPGGHGRNRPAPPQLRGRIFRGSTVVNDGLLSRNDLRSAAWQRLFRDIYADTDLTLTHRARCLAVSRWLAPPGTAIAGRAAAALHGAAATANEEPIDVLTPADVRMGPISGVRVHRGLREATDAVDRDGILVTTVTRTCWDLACWLTAMEAVVVVDALLRQRLTSQDDLRAYAWEHRDRRGWRALLRVVELTDGGAESPQESRTRVHLVRAGLPRPVTQYVITGQGRFIARVDLAWPAFKVAVEYDGRWHDDPEQLHRDRRRLNQLVGEGWLVLHVTARRLREDLDGFLGEVHIALRSRGARL